jgi:hypothetical protein
MKTKTGRGKGREGTGPFFTSPHAHFPSEPTRLSAVGTQHRFSLVLQCIYRYFRRGRITTAGSIASTMSKQDSLSSTHTAPESSTANLQHTVASLQQMAQPKIDAAL